MKHNISETKVITFSRKINVCANVNFVSRVRLVLTVNVVGVFLICQSITVFVLTTCFLTLLSY
jgi:hypothetical protein